MTSYTLDAGERLTPNLLTERDYKDTTGITQTGNGIVESLLPARTLRITMPGSQKAGSLL